MPDTEYPLCVNTNIYLLLYQYMFTKEFTTPCIYVSILEIGIPLVFDLSLCYHICRLVIFVYFIQSISTSTVSSGLIFHTHTQVLSERFFHNKLKTRKYKFISFSVQS